MAEADESEDGSKTKVLKEVSAFVSRPSARPNSQSTDVEQPKEERFKGN